MFRSLYQLDQGLLMGKFLNLVHCPKTESVQIRLDDVARIDLGKTMVTVIGNYFGNNCVRHG